MLEKRENEAIGAHTTFGIGGTVKHFIRIRKESDIPLAVAMGKRESLPLVYLGEGSNSIFSDGMIDAIVMKIEIPGFAVVAESDDYADVCIGAGVHWDDAVAEAVRLGLGGIEALSAIPGTAGATPFQNVGAYGQEIKDTLVSVRAYDTTSESFVVLSNAECAFGYRDSVFKSKEKGRYIIASITLRLSKHAPVIPDYPSVKSYFSEREITQPTLSEIRHAIIDIRSHKLPDPALVKNAGSFFKNPIVTRATAHQLKATYPDIPLFDVGERMVKIPAGWLIEHAGLKGARFGPIEIYEHNALVLVNSTDASFADLHSAQHAIIEKVRSLFGVTLEPEPVFVK